MPVDASIYNNLNTIPYNPLKTIGDVTAIQNAQQQGQYAQGKNQLQQANIRANQIFANNTDENGYTDKLKALAQIAQDPVAAPATPNATDWINSQTTPTAYLDENNQQKLRSPFEQAQEYNKNPNNPLQLSSQQALQGQSNQADDAQPPTQDQIDQAHDHFNYLGDAITSLIKKPGGATASDIINTVADANAEFVKSGGKRGLSTQEATGVLGTIPAGANGGEATPSELTPWLQQNLLHVRGMQGAVTQAHGAPSSAQNQNTEPSSTRNASPTPGYSDLVSASQGRIKQIYDNATAAPEAAAPLNKMIELSQQIQTGPGTDSVNKLKSFLSANGVANDKMSDAAATYAEFQKYANRVAQVQGDGHTNPYLSVVQSSNPNDKQLPETIQNVARFALAQIQGNVAKQTAMRNMIGDNPTPKQEQAFNSDWNQSYDPRAIEFTMLPASKKSDYLNKLSPKEAQKLGDSLDMLKEGGAIK